MEKITVGLQLYSIRDFLEQDFMGTLEKVAEMGYDAVELCGLYGYTAKEIKEKCDGLGLAPISAHITLEDMQKSGVIEAYAEIGCKYAVIPWCDWQTDFVGADGYEAYKQNIRKAAEECKKHGITLLYHNHDFEFVKIDGEYKLDILYNDLPAEVLKTEIDTCWARVGGVDPAEYIFKYTGRAPLVHLKDYVGEKSANMYELIGDGKVHDTGANGTVPFDFRPVGYGVQDVKALVEASNCAGAEAVIVEQDRPSMDKTSLECAQMSVRYIKSLF